MGNETKISASLYIGVAGIPQGWELVNKYAVEHPRDGRKGALIRNKSNGNYVLFADGVMRSYPSPNWGGRRAGAGRKPSPNPKILWAVKVTPQEKEYLKQRLTEYRNK